jgi:signal transduction histidine kinase
MVPDGIVCVDTNRLFYYANPSAETLLEENIELKSILFGEGMLEDALKNYSREEALSRLAGGSQETGFRTELFGNRASVFTNAKKFEIELGTHIVLIRDLTDQFLIDEEIGKLYRHEMRATLDVMGVGLNGISDLVESGQKEDAVKYIEQVEEKRSELASMLEERIDFIRLHSDSFQISSTIVNLNLVIEKCVSKNRELAGPRKVTINSDHLHCEAVFAYGEEKYLVRAIDNIIRNAVHFSRNGGSIHISIDNSRKEACVSVRDDGPGIDPKNIGKIFQLGYTTSGTGRGLYLTKRIMTAHKGRIEVKSKPGNGACFNVYLPLATES